MPAEEYFNLYKKCVDVQSIQFTLEDFKRFTQSSNIKIITKRNCIAILGLTDSEIEIYFIGVEEKFRGRVMSINQLSWGSAALGALMVGYLAEIISIKFAFQFIGLSSFFIIFFGAMLTASIILKKK